MDKVLVANEAVDYTTKPKKDIFLFKVDFEEAYDNIN